MALHHTRTRRHDAIRDALGTSLKSIREDLETGNDLYQVHTEITEACVQTLRHDLLLVYPDPSNRLSRVVIDVNVSAILEPYHIQYPSENDILTAMECDKAATHAEPDFFWEDHSKEKVSELTLRGRAFRRLLAEAVVSPTIDTATKLKVTRFAARFREPSSTTSTQFVPFILSAGGGIGTEAVDFLKQAMRCTNGLNSPASTSQILKFRNNVRRRLSILLLRFSYYSANRTTARRRLD